MSVSDVFLDPEFEYVFRISLSLTNFVLCDRKCEKDESRGGVDL
jgi:hypothetical protein